MARYRVKYYDALQSKKGRGIQVKVFTDRIEAEAFAAKNRVYSEPCKVEEIPMPLAHTESEVVLSESARVWPK